MATVTKYLLEAQSQCPATTRTLWDGAAGPTASANAWQRPEGSWALLCLPNVEEIRAFVALGMGILLFVFSIVSRLLRHWKAFGFGDRGERWMAGVVAVLGVGGVILAGVTFDCTEQSPVTVAGLVTPCLLGAMQIFTFWWDESVKKKASEAEIERRVAEKFAAASQQAEEPMPIEGSAGTSGASAGGETGTLRRQRRMEEGRQ